MSFITFNPNLPRGAGTLPQPWERSSLATFSATFRNGYRRDNFVIRFDRRRRWYAEHRWSDPTQFDRYFRSGEDVLAEGYATPSDAAAAIDLLPAA